MSTRKSRLYQGTAGQVEQNRLDKGKKAKRKKAKRVTKASRKANR